jgi:Phosphodiester glycosidase
MTSCFRTVITTATLALTALIPMSAQAALDAWTDTVIADGVQWRAKEYTTLFGYRQNVNVLDIDLDNSNVIVQPILGTPTGSCEKTSSMGARLDAVAAVNGGFYSPASCAGVSMLKIDDSYITSNPSSVDRAALGIDQSTNTPIIDWNAAWDSWPAVNDALGGGPNLVSNGLIDLTYIAEGFDYSFTYYRHPRTAVGYTSDNHLIMVTVDGRTTFGGMALDDLAQYMIWLGCVEAMNLDGGGSTAMYVRGEPYSGVVSCPSDNGVADHYGERSVVTSLAVWAPQEEIIDNTDSGFATYPVANWGTSTQVATKYGDDYVWHNVTASWVNEYCKWEPELESAGDYEVFVWYPEHGWRPTNAAYTIYYDGGYQTVNVNQQINGGQWVSLGTYPFDKDSSSPQWVKMWTVGDYGAVVGDAMRFIERW